MNNLFLHIEYLVLRHECVVVPGFGAFISRRHPALIDMEKGIILPPSQTLAFNRSVSMDDGLLVNSYVRKYGMSIEEARLAIVRAASKLQESLVSDRKVVCGNIGAFSMDEEGHILFTPESDPFLTSAFSKVPLSVEVKPEESRFPALEMEKERKDYYSFRISKKFIRSAAVIFAVCAICLSVILNPIPTDNREQRASVIPVESLIPQKNDEPATEPETPAVAEENSDVETAVEREPDTHFLIIGTFATESEATRFSENCDSGDFTLQIVPSRKVFRVAAASSGSREELREILNSRECRKRFPNSWIWSRP